MEENINIEDEIQLYKIAIKENQDKEVTIMDESIEKIKEKVLPPQPLEHEIVAGLYYYEDKEIDFKNNITLTFDDGPNFEEIEIADTQGKITRMAISDLILDVLKENHIRAVFFINGKNLLNHDGIQHPEAERVLERIINEGHEIGNHSFYHNNLTKEHYNDDTDDINDIIKDLMLTADTVNQILGYNYTIRYFRTPYAEPGRNEKVDMAAKQMNYMQIVFQIDSLDWMITSSSNWAIENTLKHLRSFSANSSGGTILFHECSITALHLAEIIALIKELENKNGKFNFADMEKLFRLKYYP